MKERTLLAIIAMLCITWLETLNLIFYGVDGAILSTLIMAISGLAGYELAKKREKR